MIQLKNIQKTYHRNKPDACEALKDISLDIDDGELLGIIGKSGAGKSTLLHILSCIDKADAGELRIDGRDVSRLKDTDLSALRNQSMGIVMQDYALIDGFSVLENILVPLAFCHGKRKEKREKAVLAARQVGIEKLIHKNVNQLSGGQKQRVAIARALINSPHYVLADEPTGALDTQTTREILDIFTDLHQKGITVILVTHEKSVYEICQRIVELEDGAIIRDIKQT